MAVSRHQLVQIMNWCRECDKPIIWTSGVTGDRYKDASPDFDELK